MTIKDRVYNSLLALMPLILFFPQYISNRLMGWLDLPFYFLPFRMLTSDYIRQGVMPFWNPYIYCGNPLLANMQSAVFYPFNIFYHVLPAAAAVRITTYIAFAVMALFTYAFMRQYKVSEEGSFVSAVIFAFGFYSMIKAVEFAEINVMAWMPAALYFTKKFADSARSADFFMIPMMLALSLLGGHAQLFIYVWMLFAAFFIYENIWLKEGSRLDGIRDFFVINLILLALTVIQLLPTARFVLLSKRVVGGLGYGSVMGGFLNLDHIVTFVFPFLGGLFSAQSNFLNWFGLVNTGVFAILMLILGAFMIKDSKLRIFLMAVFTLFLFMTFTGWLPFYRELFDKLPFLASLRYQSKAVLGVFFIMCLIFAKGFDELFSRTREELEPFTYFSVGSFIVMLFTYIFAWLYKNNILIFYKKFFEPGMSMQRIYDAVDAYDTVLSGFLLYLLVFASAVFIIYMAGSGLRRGNGMKTAAVAVALTSLFAFQDWAQFQYVKADFMEKKTVQTDFLYNKSSIGSFRILAPALFNHFGLNVNAMNEDELVYYCNDTLAPNIPMYHRIKNVDGFDSLFLGDFAAFKSCFNVTRAPWSMPAFSLFSAKYISSMAKLSGAGLRLASHGFTDIYENANRLEPAFMVKSPFEAVTAGRDKAKELIASKTFDPE